MRLGDFLEPPDRQPLRKRCISIPKNVPGYHKIFRGSLDRCTDHTSNEIPKQVLSGMQTYRKSILQTGICQWVKTRILRRKSQYIIGACLFYEDVITTGRNRGFISVNLTRWNRSNQPIRLPGLKPGVCSGLILSPSIFLRAMSKPNGGAFYPDLKIGVWRRRTYQNSEFLTLKNVFKSFHFFSPIPFTFFSSSTSRNPFFLSR